MLLLIAFSMPNTTYGQTKRLSGQRISLPARPGPINIDISHTAVIVVDMENDFGSKGGMLDRAGVDISMIQNAVAPTAKVLAVARQAGIKIIYLKMGYREDLSDLGAEDSPNRLRHLEVHVGDTMTTSNGTRRSRPGRSSEGATKSAISLHVAVWVRCTKPSIASSASGWP